MPDAPLKNAGARLQYKIIQHTHHNGSLADKLHQHLGKVTQGFPNTSHFRSSNISVRVLNLIANTNIYHLYPVNAPLPQTSSSRLVPHPVQRSLPTNELPLSLVALVLVTAVHAGALGLAFYANGLKKPDVIELPRVQGILLLAPPAEQVAIPSAPETPPTVEPPPPEVIKPKPKPEPKKPKPKPIPKPVIEVPPSETAITQEAAEPEEAPAAQQPAALPLTDKTDTLGAPVTPPREDAHHLNNPRPAYPSLSRRLREQGTVVLEILILADGRVGDVRIKESSGFSRLDETAAKAVRQWRYLPARRGNQAIDYWYLQPIEFSLN